MSFRRFSAGLATVWVVLYLLAAVLDLPAVAAPQGPPQGTVLQRLLRDFEVYATKNMQFFGVPGMAVAVVADDKVIYSKGLGTTAMLDGRPVDANTIFQIGSTSKAFTAALLAIMVDRGKIGWSDQVIDHFPEFMMKDPWVTRQLQIGDLLAQHTGLAPHAGDTQAFLGFGPDHMIRSLRFMEPFTSFRTTFAYQNIPHQVAAKIISRYTGKDFDTTVRELIFEPLGMTSSSVPRSGLAEGKNVTRLHQRKKGKTILLPTDWQFQDWIYTYAPSGGINSNIKDMIQWLRLNINQGQIDGKQVISAKAMVFVHSPVTPVAAKLAEGRLAQYCQGWVYERSGGPYTMIFHNGDTTANHAMIAFMPGRKVGIVMLSNLGGVQMLDQLARYFCDLYTGTTPLDYCAEEFEKVLAADKEGQLPPRPKDATEPQPLERYTGVYSNPIYGDAVVAKDAHGLALTLGPKQIKTLLTPWNRDQFIIMGFEDPNEAFSLANFEMDASGKICQFKVEFLLHEAEGLFTRIR